jgi:hypothetical protein
MSGGMDKRMRGLVAACLVAATGAEADGVVFPDDPAVLDARADLGAKGDGTADDTEALQAGLDGSCGGRGGSKVLYLPDGVYRVTRTLVVPHGVGPWVYGQSRDGAVIRLDDGAASASVTAVLRTHPNDAQATSADYFMRNFRNLTIDAGDNPGVDGIRWFGNNSSILQNVRVTGNGKVGINSGFVGQNGPNLVQDVVVEGFETGILSQWMWGQTLSRVTVRNGRSNAVHVSANSVAIEKLVVENTPVAIFNDYPNDWTWWGGVVALVGGRLATTNSTHAAIRNRSVLYARDVACRGYARAIESGTPGGNVEGGSVGEYLSHEPARAFEDSPAGSFRLPVKAEPAVPWETNLARWVCANDHGAAPGDNADDTAALQRAIDRAAEAGATTVYLRGIGGGDPNWYTLDGEVRVHGSVRHILGLGFGRVVAGPAGRVVVDDRSAPVVKLQHLQAFGGRGLVAENRSASSALVVESCDGTVLGTGGGDIFITDCPARVELRAPRQRAWARQLNPEGSDDAGLVRNHGGDLWVLGVKHEGAGVRFLNDNGGRTEVFGMFNYGPGLDAGDTRPIVETDSSPFCLMGAREINFGGSSYPVKVREVRGGETRAIEGGGWIGWAMYSGWASNQLAGGCAVARPTVSPRGGTFLDAVSVGAATTTEGASLRYTLDGTDPDPDSPRLPAPLVLASTATLRFEGFFDAPVDGLYTFRTISDDGSRLWIGGALVVDNDGLHEARERSGVVALKAGPHHIAIAFFQGRGASVLRAEVEGPALARQTLDPRIFAPAARDKEED